MIWIAVVVLGAVGAILRAMVAERLPPLVATSAVNIAAAFLLGWTAGFDGALGAGVRVGLLGALSTWSTLANQLAELGRERRWVAATAYLTSTLVVGVAAAWVGLELA